MTRRSSSTRALSAIAAAVLLLGACGEQTPGGMPADGDQVAQASGDGGQGGQGSGEGSELGGQGSGDQVEDERGSGHEGDQVGQDTQFDGAEADDPIVVKIGKDEYRTNMAIYRRYDEAKGGPLALRAPVAPAEEIEGGKKQDYATGSIYWSPGTGAKIVRGEILATYLEEGGPAGTLGWPVGDETVEGEAIYSDFEHGQIRLEDQSIRVIEHGA